MILAQFVAQSITRVPLRWGTVGFSKTFWRQTRKSTVDIGGRSPCCLRLEAASDVQECLATLRSLTSRRTEAQRRAMPLRPGAFPFRSPCSEALACGGPRAEGDSSVREERRRGIAVSAQWVVASSERQTAAPPPHPPPRCRFFFFVFFVFSFSIFHCVWRGPYRCGNSRTWGSFWTGSCWTGPGGRWCFFVFHFSFNRKGCASRTGTWGNVNVVMSRMSQRCWRPTFAELGRSLIKMFRKPAKPSLQMRGRLMRSQSEAAFGLQQEKATS